MPVSVQNMPLYRDLQKKRSTLFNYVMRLHNEKTVENEPFVNIEIDKADWELRRINAVMVDLNENNEIDFPSDAQLQKMRNEVAALETAVARSGAVEALIQAGTAVIAAWPN